VVDIEDEVEKQGRGEVEAVMEDVDVCLCLAVVDKCKGGVVGVRMLYAALSDMRPSNII
jgi:hypothetical protein